MLINALLPIELTYFIVGFFSSHFLKETRLQSIPLLPIYSWCAFAFIIKCIEFMTFDRNKNAREKKTPRMEQMQ